MTFAYNTNPGDLLLIAVVIIIVAFATYRNTK